MEIFDVLVDMSYEEYYKSSDVMLTCIKKYRKILAGNEWIIEIYYVNPNLKNYSSRIILNDDIFWLRIFPELSTKFSNNDENLIDENKLIENNLNNNIQVLNLVKFKIPSKNIIKWWEKNKYYKLFVRYYMLYKKPISINSSEVLIGINLSTFLKRNDKLNKLDNNKIINNETNNSELNKINNIELNVSSNSSNHSRTRSDVSNNTESFNKNKHRKSIVDKDRHIVELDIFNFLFEFYKIRYFKVVFYKWKK